MVDRSSNASKPKPGLGQSPSQTVGPYFAYSLSPAQYGYPYSSVVTPDLAKEGAEGERIRLLGRVLDGAGKPIDDAMIEIWQANAHGRYNHPADRRADNRLDPDFTGFGRSGTGADAQSRFVFDTVKPGAIGDGQAPHLNMIVMMRGLLSHVFTRVYFDDQVDANAEDPVLALVPESRRSTLIARRAETSSGIVYHIDIHMQGPNETVFFDV
ncbi:MAG: protocatechuate 3,4-dioxygenase subunit alpha [Geminicoccaceae bacterium]